MLHTNHASSRSSRENYAPIARVRRKRQRLPSSFLAAASFLSVSLRIARRGLRLTESDVRTDVQKVCRDEALLIRSAEPYSRGTAAPKTMMAAISRAPHRFRCQIEEVGVGREIVRQNRRPGFLYGRGRRSTTPVTENGGWRRCRERWSRPGPCHSVLSRPELG
jgi:hypothetical protein